MKPNDGYMLLVGGVAFAFLIWLRFFAQTEVHADPTLTLPKAQAQETPGRKVATGIWRCEEERDHTTIILECIDCREPRSVQLKCSNCSCGPSK